MTSTEARIWTQNLWVASLRASFHLLIMRRRSHPPNNFTRPLRTHNLGHGVKATNRNTRSADHRCHLSRHALPLPRNAYPRRGSQARYPNVNIHVYKPEGVFTTAEFEARHGKELWKTNSDLYDWLAKVDPAQRAYNDLALAVILKGRRRSQGVKRESLDIIEIFSGPPMNISYS